MPDPAAPSGPHPDHGPRDRLAGAWRGAREVQRRFAAARGSNLAAAIAFRGYLALFAILVLAVAVAGYVNASGRDAADWIIQSLGLSGEAARTVSRAVERAQTSRAATTVVGLLGLVWTGTGLAAAISYAWNAAWSIPGGGMRGRARGVLWLLAGGVCTVVAVGATAFTTAHRFPWILAFAIGAAADLALVVLTARLLPARRIPVRSMLPGAFAAAVGLTLARLLGAVVLTGVIRNSSAVYGSIGTFFALLLWMLVIGYILVLAALVEVSAWVATRGTVSVEVEVPAPT
ncbi:MAG: YihY/virulence factor BrkB family protein [Actinomycetes bacterium]